MLYVLIYVVAGKTPSASIDCPLWFCSFTSTLIFFSLNLGLLSKSFICGMIPDKERKQRQNSSPVPGFWWIWPHFFLKFRLHILLSQSLCPFPFSQTPRYHSNQLQNLKTPNIRTNGSLFLKSVPWCNINLYFSHKGTSCYSPINFQIAKPFGLRFCRFISMAHTTSV